MPDTEELVKKFKEHDVIQWFKSMSPNSGCCKFLKLVGGAVVDILEGREPKDYDFVDWDSKFVSKMLENGFKFECDSATAETFVYNDNGYYIKVQLLKKEEADFDFTISQTSLKLNHGRCILVLPDHSFEHKTLIPVSYEAENAKNSLLRIPHWRAKGYDIHPTTYLSLVRAACSTNQDLKS